MTEKIGIYIDGRSFTNKGSGFAVILLSKNNKWLRSFAYGKYSVNQSDLLALKFGLLSIGEKSKSCDVTVYTKNDYIIGIFAKENGQYKQMPSSNVDLINDIKMFNLNISFEKSTGEFADICKNMAISAIKEGKLIDLRK